jgi:hypothetical protein
VDSEGVTGRENRENGGFYGEIRDGPSRFPMEGMPGFLIPESLNNPVVYCLVCPATDKCHIV